MGKGGEEKHDYSDIFKFYEYAHIIRSFDVVYVYFGDNLFFYASMISRREKKAKNTVEFFFFKIYAGCAHKIQQSHQQVEIYT